MNKAWSKANSKLAPVTILVLHHLPSHLRSYVQSFPNVTLDVHFVDSEQAHEKVLAGDLELAFNASPKLDERLQYVTIWEDPLVFVAAPFHPLAQMQNHNSKT